MFRSTIKISMFWWYLLNFYPIIVLACDQEYCQNVGSQTVCYDPSCAQGGVGCNAGGQGQNCRFCGFDQYPPCPGGSQTQGPPVTAVTGSGQCQSVGGQTTCYDLCCTYGIPPAGCNAGGTNQNCRYCGFGAFLPCSDVCGKTTVEPVQPTSTPPGQCVSTDSENCVQFVNNCQQSIAVGLLGSPSIPNGGGFTLEPNGGGQNVYLDAQWTGRFWGRTGCFECGQCSTGDCGGAIQCNGAGGQPPATLAEITFRGWQGLDYYDISNVDGFNLPLRFAPIDGTFNLPASNYTCTEANCLANLNADCPSDFAIHDVYGNVVGCKSACLAYNTPEYCCTGEYSSPQTCKATQYADQVKAQCPLAYSYAYDDVKSTFTCIGNNAPSAAYRVTFC